MIRSGKGSFPGTRNAACYPEVQENQGFMRGNSVLCEMTQNDRVEIYGVYKTQQYVLGGRSCNKCYLLRFLLFSREPTVIAEWPPSIGILKSCIGGPIEVDEIEGFLTETPM
jgi:hypothetical protein